MRATTALLSLILLASAAASPAIAADASSGGRENPAAEALERLLSRDGDEAAARAPDEDADGPGAIDPLAPQDCRLLVPEAVRPA